ncbi:MAG: GNAT family N-acetyltransferase, partial [Bdellovibrionales bacterium]
FLKQHTDTSMFIRSNLAKTGITFQDKPYHGDYWGAFDQKAQYQGVLAHYWNGNIMTQTQSPETLYALLDTFKKTSRRTIKGVLGEQKEVNLVINRLAIPVQDISLNSKTGLFTLDLDKLILPEHRDLELIDAKKLDKNLLFDWLKAYDIEAIGSEDNQETNKMVQEGVERVLSEPDMWALSYKGTPVSLSGFNARLPDIVQIGPVWTPPQHRSKGYARAIVALTLEKARTEGVKKAVLFTDSEPAQKAYEAVGFSRVGDFGITLLKKPLEYNNI